ncbi:alpha/beta fold hydrolase [Epidermidibacterium keratini]|uniref:Alpha/beta fold hydrolase n=1 Tax=Epidermidibacterium keratini TaxID=1891644 RepID=A0A7L4YPU8_9ACTN|nr:alpha/beta fold hydrolase [Epidermidibacterium keratini]QHC00914.1 alpha/beta fold hydrolase [Epidermidibacterium keratini]
MADHRDVALADGRVVTVYRAGVDDPAAPALVMHYGTPHTGRHPARIAELAGERGLQLVAVTRAGYGATARRVGRTVADSARDTVDALDQLGISQVAVAGYSGGGPHALAHAALLGERVADVATFASPAPYDGSEAWFGGMAADGGGLRPAAEGRAVREEHQRTAKFDPASFTDADWAALAGPWAGIGEDAQAANAAGSDDGEIDDDLAFVAPWGVEIEQITARVTLFHGGDDRIVPSHHADLLAGALSAADLRHVAGSGHVAILDELPGWMGEVAAGLRS